MRPVVLHNHSKKLGRSLEPFLGKGKKSNKNTCFGYLISYNPGLRFFSETPFCSNNWPYYPLHLRKQLGDPWTRFGENDTSKDRHIDQQAKVITRSQG